MRVLQAVKLKESFIDLHRAGPLTLEKLKEANISWTGVFEELPITIEHSNLAKAVLAQIQPSFAGNSEFKELQLGTGPVLHKSLDFMNEYLDEVVAEQQKVRSNLAAKLN